MKILKTVNTKYGNIAGVDCGNYVVYRGIPYAKAPIGSLRWKAPEDPDKFEGTFMADKFAAKCPQFEQDPAGPQMGFNYGNEFYSKEEFKRPMSEDCLYLNIWTPANCTKASALPVAFYIHGGAFMSGYSSEEEFDGESYADKGVILVTIGYRLGVFGFLAHEWLSQENQNGISGNYGILDQIKALEWVYENISAFGGNPDNITVFGQSAGSMSTQVLVSSDLTKNMISKAILQSGISCESDFLITPNLKEEMGYGKNFVELTGASSISELRALSTEELMKCQDKFMLDCFQKGLGFVFVPTVDGYLLSKSVKEVYDKGLMKKIPYITGFVGNDIGQTEDDAKANKPGVIEDECKKWAIKAEDATGEPVFVYSFEYNLPGDDSGPFHSSELWYTFGTYKRSWRPMGEHDAKLSEDMVSYWTNFMKYGKPSKDENEWGAYTKENKNVKVFC